MSRSPGATGRWLDAHLPRFDGPAQYLGGEPGSLLAEYGGNRERLWEDRSRFRIWLAASWDYSQAAGNMAIPAVYRAVIDADPGNLADRWYLPATPRDLEMLDKAGIGPFGIETRHPARDFDVVATSISYTVLFQNFCSYLMRARIPLRRADREARLGDYPMIMAGGQAYCAPEFMSPVLDCVWLGEAEDAAGTPGGIGEVASAIAAFKASGSWAGDRAGCYERLARWFSHLYFPRFTEFSYRYEDRGLPELTKVVSGHWPVLAGMRYPHRKRHVADLDEMRPLVRMPLLYGDPGMGSGDVEVARGCPAWCTFCRLSYVTKPARQHSVEYVTEAARQLRLSQGSVDIALVAPDPPMHTQRKALIASLLENVTDEVDASSMRVDDYLADEDFSLLMAIGGADSLTLGLEAGSERLRDFAGKGLSDAEVCRVVAKALRSGIRRIKLYAICNWPGEDEHDVMRVVELGRRLADIRDSLGPAVRKARIQFSWTPLLIEAQTPLQWFAVTSADYTLQKAMDMLRDLRIDLKLGTKANPAKLAFFQACQRASRDAGEALADVIEGIGMPSWGGFPADMKDRLDAALAAHGFRNGLEDLFGERYEDDLLGWEHIDTGVSRALLWRAYADMVRFLEGTGSRTYRLQGPASGNEWIPRCDQACQGQACGACDHADLRIRTGLIRAAASERDLGAQPVTPVDHTTVACRLRFPVSRPEAYRYVSAESLRFQIRAAAFRACEMTRFPAIAKREVRLASDPLSYRDRSAGLDYAEIGVTRPVSAEEAGLFMAELARQAAPQLEWKGTFEVLPAAAKMPARPVSLWELETGDSPDALAAALRWWDSQDRVPVLVKSDSFYANAQADREDARSHVADFWIARDGHRVVLRMLLNGRLGPYQAAQALLRKASWLPLADRPALRLGFFGPGASTPRPCPECGGPVPEGLLGEPYGERCPRCADEAAGQIIAGLLRAGVLPDTSYARLWRTCGLRGAVTSVRDRPVCLGGQGVHGAERGVGGGPGRAGRADRPVSALPEETRPCAYPPCQGRMEPELDGRVTVWACGACQSESYETRGAEPGTCQAGLPLDSQQEAAPGGPVYLGATIGRRPR